MNWLPRGTPLGTLAIVETYVFHDGPRVFSCKSLTDQLYLVAWANEGASEDLWIYVAASQARINLVRSGGITLRRALTAPEGAAYVVYLPHDARLEDRLEGVDPGQIEDSWLPGEDFALNLPTATQQTISAAAVQRLAGQEYRTRFRLEVSPPNMTTTELSTKIAGELLILTQNLFDNLGLALDSPDPPQSGRIPGEIAQQTASNLVGTSASSFVLELASRTSDDLFGESLFTRTTKQLLTLLAGDLRQHDLSVQLAELRPRAAKSFRRFVTGLANINGDVVVAAAGAHMPYASRELPPDRLKDLVRILTNLVPEGEVREIRGVMKLYSGDTQRRTFGLRDEHDEISYEGKIEDRAFLSVHNATLDALYDVVLIETSILDEVVGETKTTYSLAQLIPAEDDER